jgi:hypothetical protein
MIKILRNILVYIRCYVFTLKVLWIYSNANVFVFLYKFIWHHKNLKIKVLNEPWPKDMPPKITITEVK